MKLLLAIVQQHDEHALSRALSEAGLRATKLASSGSFLGTRNSTFLIGLPATEVDRALDLIRKTCGRRVELDPNSPFLEGQLRGDLPTVEKVSVGGATIFVLGVEKALLSGA